MPFAALPAVDRSTRRAMADALWRAMLASNPALGPAIALQQRLVGDVLDLVETFEDGRLRRLSLPAGYVTTKLRSGIPALVGEPVQAPLDQLRPTLIRLVDDLAASGGGEATQGIKSALDTGRLDVGALLTLALRREQAGLRLFATRAGLGHDLLWLVLDLTTGPLAHALLETTFAPAAPGSALRAALDDWSKGYCPLCGSWPVFIEDLDPARRLRCSFCACAWQPSVHACVYCGEAAEGFTSIITNRERPRRSIEACSSCRGYVKVVPMETSLPFPLLVLPDLETMDLDVAAMQRGFARPAMKQFARR